MTREEEMDGSWHGPEQPPEPGSEVILWVPWFGAGERTGLSSGHLTVAGYWGGEPRSEHSWDVSDVVMEVAEEPSTWRWRALPGAEQFSSCASAPWGRELLIRAGEASWSFGERSSDRDDPERTPGGWVLEHHSPEEIGHGLWDEDRWTWTEIGPPSS